MQVGRIEFSDGGQTVPVEDPNGLALPTDQAFGAQLLQGTIDVHGGEPERVTELGLVDGEHKLAVDRAVTDHGKAGENLAEQVRHLLQR